MTIIAELKNSNCYQINGGCKLRAEKQEFIKYINTSVEKRIEKAENKNTVAYIFYHFKLKIGLQ